MAKTDPVLDELRAAVKGLLFPSETDAPLEAFAWPGASRPPTEATLRANAQIDEDALVQQITLADLATMIPEESRVDFLALFAILGRLIDPTVFKVGEANMDVYVVGRTTDGRYAGVKTQVVET
jgi:hypothetical protein